MSKTYFISDTHFYHKNVLIYEPCRMQATIDFLGLSISCEDAVEKYKNDESFKEQMLNAHNEMLIQKWNSTVRSDDIVWFLGDFCLGNREKMGNIVSRLKGHKYIVMGNHDNFSKQVYENAGFEKVYDRPVVLKNKFILSHAPMFIEYEEDEDSGETTAVRVDLGDMFNIYGHVHSLPEYQTKTENTQCVCVERQGFVPVTIPEFDSCESV